jgi:hypothetical protein
MRFLPIFSEKNCRFFSKANAYDLFFCKIAFCLSQKCHFFAKFFCEIVFENHNIGFIFEMKYSLHLTRFQGERCGRAPQVRPEGRRRHLLQLATHPEQPPAQRQVVSAVIDWFLN